MLLKYHTIKYPNVGTLVREELKPFVDAEIRKLQMLNADITNIPICRNLDEIIAKLGVIQSSGEGQLTSYEVQTLAFHLIDLSESLHTYFLSDYIPHNWKPIVIRGLMHSLLQFWDKPFAEQVRDVLNTHRRDMSQLQSGAFDYMESSTSGTKLGIYLFNHRLPIFGAPQFVLLQDEMFHYPYFEDVIAAYFKECKIDSERIKIADEVMGKHNVARFDRILLPLIIIKADKQSGFSENEKKELTQVTSKHIGDANDMLSWQDDTLNDQQKKELIKARQIIRTWQIVRVIDNVFNRGAKDSYPDRAKFWRKYAKYLLKLNDEAQPYLRVLSTYGLSDILNFNERKLYYRHLSRGQDNTAILMRFGEYTFVELLDGGCMYAYRNNHSQVSYMNPYSYVWSNSIHDINDLKDTNTCLITKDEIYNEVHLPAMVKIAHRGEWQSYFRHFLKIQRIIV